MLEPRPAIEADGSNRWTWADLGWLLAIGSLGLAVRLGYVLEYTAHATGRTTWVDEGAYWSRALEIVRGRWLPSEPFYQDPLFPYVLALLIKVAGPSVATIRVVLACIGALTPVMIFLAGRRGLGRAEGVVAGMVAAAYGPLIFTDGLLEKEGLAALLASMALLAMATARTSSPTRWRIGLAGWAWGLVALVRANALLIGPPGVCWALAIGRGRRTALALAFSIGFALAILPATVINAIVGRPPELILTTCQSGANFYIGNGPEATGTYQAPDFVRANPAYEADDFRLEAWRRSGRALSPGQVSRFWFGEGLRRWQSAPGNSSRLLLAKLGLLLHDFEIPDNQDLEFVRAVASPRLGWGFLSFGWLAPCAILGLARSRRERSPFWWMVSSSTVVGLLSTAGFFVVARYRIPWVPGLALLGGVGLVDLARRIKTRAWKSLAWRLGLLALPMLVLAWRPMADPVPDRWGHAEIILAVAELGESHLEAAIDALDDARAISPGSALRVGEITSSGPVHDRMVSLIRAHRDRLGGEANIPRLQQARWLRQVSEGRATSRKLLDEALLANPDDRQALRESAAWSLGDLDHDGSRYRASLELARASRNPGGDLSASILLALLCRDFAPLPDPGSSKNSQFFPRITLARTILREDRFQKRTDR